MSTEKIIHKDKADSFKEWMAHRGWTEVQTKGQYEAFRLLHPAKPKEPFIAYRKINSDYLTVEDKNISYALEFVAQDKQPIIQKVWPPTNAITEFRGNYAYLSNFHDSPVIYMGIRYLNNEAAFQAQKTTDLEEKLKFTTVTGKEAKRLGQKVKLRENWEGVKNSIMSEICLCKFFQNGVLMEKLLSTDGRHLYEGNSWGDKHWGVDIKTGAGENILGRILMNIRDLHRWAI